MADELFKVVQSFDSTLELKYNKFYIGLARNGQPDNFVVFRPQKTGLVLEVRLDQSSETQAKIEQEGLNTLDYSRWGYYRLKLFKDDLEKHRAFLRETMLLAFEASRT